MTDRAMTHKPLIDPLVAPSVAPSLDLSRRVLVAMSGGVDSSVAACLMQERGLDVVGVFMALTKADGYSGCCSRDDRRDAFAVAEARGFRFMAVNYQEHFDDLKAYFLREYDAGRTPNPCVRCNSQLKFGELVALADRLHCQWIATGHYAQVRDGKLLRGLDPAKDQSYALATIDARVLSRLHLPCGGYAKDDIRQMARERFGLTLGDKPDSQDLCFVKHDYRDVLVESGRLTPGRMIDTHGRLLAHHEGYQQFTIGQRKGLGIGGGGTVYRVVGINPATATVVVSADPADLESARVELDEVVWLDRPTAFPARIDVQIRYHGETWPGEVFEDGVVRLDAPARAVTPGQLAAFYSGDQVLGGGFISQGRVWPAAERPAEAEGRPAQRLHATSPGERRGVSTP